MKTCRNCSKEFYAREGTRTIYCSDQCRREYEAAHSPEYEIKKGVRVHRVIAEQKLGRPLLPGEVVHHIDGNKRNNHPDNLMIFSSNGEHIQYEFREGNIQFSHEHRVLLGKLSGKVRRQRKQAGTRIKTKFIEP